MFSFWLSLLTLPLILLPILSTNDLFSILLDWSALRAQVDRSLTVGLNRHLNSFAFLITVSISLVTGVIGNNREHRIVSGVAKSLAYFNLFSFILIVIVFGSRQNLLFAGFLLSTQIMYQRRIHRRPRLLNIKAILPFVVVFFIFIAAMSTSWTQQLVSQVEERFIDRTVSVELQGGSKRMEIYNTALQLIARRPLFGFGSGSFREYSDGAAPHNSYLGLASQVGLLPLSAFAVGFYIFWRRTSVRNAFARVFSAEYYLFARSSLLTVMVISVSFNDILETPTAWVFAAIMIASLQPRVDFPNPRWRVTPSKAV